MPKLHVEWRLSEGKVPTDSKERGAGWGLLMAMVEQNIESGIVKDWGAFPSEGRGYFIAEATIVEIMKMTAMYNPYVTFQVKLVASVEELDEMTKHLSGE